MKKFAIILLSIALVCSCALVAFADPSTPEYSITVNNAVPAETYRAFKILDASLGEMPEGASASGADAFNYTITPASQWWSVLITPTSGTAPDPSTQDHFTVDGLTFQRSAATLNGQPVYNVTRDGEHTASENATFARNLANKLYGALAGKTTTYVEVAPDAVDPEEKSSVTFDLDEPGYYFVTTSVGSLCILDTTTPTVTVNDKNDVPDIDKKISKTSGSNWSDGNVNASVGDLVYFQLDVTDGKGTNQTITVEDRMTDGIALYYSGDPSTHDITVLAGNPLAPVAAGANTYTLTVNNTHSFDVVFAPAFVSSLGDLEHVYITYTGIVTPDAVVKGTTDNNSNELFNTNDVTLTYLHWEDNDQVGVETFAFDLVKTTSETYQYRLLEGAQFKLYTTQNGNTEIPVVLKETIYEIDSTTGLPTDKVEKRVYRKALAGETPVDHIDAGLAAFEGFGNGEYWFEETVAPAGYNKLTTRESITISNANDYATFLANGSYDSQTGGGLGIVNRTGAELPSTGGIGTYLFYGIGAILVVGAVVVLVSKKRMHAYSD